MFTRVALSAASSLSQRYSKSAAGWLGVKAGPSAAWDLSTPEIGSGRQELTNRATEHTSMTEPIVYIDHSEIRPGGRDEVKKAIPALNWSDSFMRTNRG
jgi:hypothetical protein